MMWKDIIGKPFITISTNNSSGADFGNQTGDEIGNLKAQVMANNYLFNQGGGIAILIDNQDLKIIPADVNTFMKVSELTILKGLKERLEKLESRLN